MSQPRRPPPPPQPQPPSLRQLLAKPPPGLAPRPPQRLALLALPPHAHQARAHQAHAHQAHAHARLAPPPPPPHVLLPKPYLRTLLALNAAPGLTASKLRAVHPLPLPLPKPRSLAVDRRRKAVLRAAVTIQRWFRATRSRRSQLVVTHSAAPAFSFHQSSPKYEKAARKIQSWFRAILFRWRFARLAATAKIVRILKSAEKVMMSWSHHESPSAIDSSTGTSSQNITHNSVGSSSSSNSNSSSVLNGVFGGLQFTDCDETSSLSNVSIRSNDGGKSSHKIQHLSVTTTITTQHQLATFSPIASPNLIPTIVQVQSQTQTLSNLKEQVSCIPSTSPRVHKMKQSTVALIERYIDCISDRNQGHVHDLGHLQLDELVNYMNGESSGILCSKSEHADETSSSNGSTTTTTTTTTSIKGSGVTIDKLINIRRMEYALMQSIYGLGHGSSCGVGNEVVTCSHEGWFASRQSYQGHHFKKEKSHEDAVMEHILSDFSSNDAAFMGKFGFTDSRREGGRSRDSSTVASMCEVVFTDTESEAASESDAFVACHCARGMCRKSGGFGACRSCTGSYSVGGMVASNDENVLDRFSETGSDIWEIV